MRNRQVLSRLWYQIGPRKRMSGMGPNEGDGTKMGNQKRTQGGVSMSKRDRAVGNTYERAKPWKDRSEDRDQGDVTMEERTRHGDLGERGYIETS